MAGYFFLPAVQLTTRLSGTLNLDFRLADAQNPVETSKEEVCEANFS
jgi:hypothetical protein